METEANPWADIIDPVNTTPAIRGATCHLLTARFHAAISYKPIDIGGHRVAVYRQGRFWHGGDLTKLLGDKEPEIKLSEFAAMHWDRIISRNIIELLAGDYAIQTVPANTTFKWDLIVHHSVHAPSAHRETPVMDAINWPRDATFYIDDLLPPDRIVLLARGAIKIRLDVPATTPIGIAAVTHPGAGPGVEDRCHYAIHIDADKVRKVDAV